MKAKRLSYFIFFSTLLFSTELFSQELYEVEILPPTAQGIMETVNGEQLKILVGNVKLKHRLNYIDCDSAVIYPNNNIDAFGHVIIRKKSGAKVYGDKLNYLSLQKVAIIRGNVILIDKKSKLHAEDITYDLNNDVGQYLTGGKMVNGESEITSQTGTFYTQQNLILFRQNVKVNHPKYKLESDSLMYNTKEKRSIFKTSTKIENDSGFIWCNAGWHDEEKNQSSFGRGTYIYNPPSWLLTDSIFYDKKNGKSYIYKTFEYHDTAAKTHLFGDSAYMYNDNKDMIAYKRPILIMESSDNKPTFVRGDILINQATSKSERVMKAISNVKLFNDNFQAAGDTLIYKTIDSTIYITKNAFLWQSQSQLSGLKLFIYLLNKKPKRINVYGNSFMAQEEEVKGHYNQVSSDSSHFFFRDGKMDYLFAFGNSKSIYYGKEEGKGYLGLNSSESYSLKMIYDTSKPKEVVFYKNPKAIFYPVKEITESNRFLTNFVWKSALRPRSKDDL
jgi:lipopolysaccharide export system protein LptA